MRAFLFVLLLAPILLSAQFQRSATELARENIRQYLTGKLFKNRPYQSISYDELTHLKGNNPDVEWYVKHRFAITETLIRADKKDTIQKSYEFIFYFDNKMHVLVAESLKSE